MNRKDFLKTLALIPITNQLLPLHALNRMTESPDSETLMPLLFLGHGSPMNAIEENEFVSGFRTISKSIPKPRAIVCVSAHWETKGSFVTAMANPRTIHDFGGFPKKLYEQQYPAPGQPKLAEDIKSQIKSNKIGLDQQWGLDHGAWSVIKHLYPKADIPVIQFSLDYTMSAKEHYELAKHLGFLRKKGILIIGSGNIVHNLGMVAWDKLNQSNYAFDWALEARQKINDAILNGNHKILTEYKQQGRAMQLAVPTPEHFLPLLYVLAMQNKIEKVNLFNDKAVGGSLTMTSVRIGNT